ncbi:TPA: head-tail connector protein [Citrobacter amalonaticus]|uniref:head-tail connector protein n=2 Tax=Citrobacter TaxID=544 RepID=UPI002016F828|nr:MULTISPECIES: head-tail connector protein [Citrobacter]MDS4039070.1 head-tail connector protein [Citrobacter amalonaticus]
MRQSLLAVDGGGGESPPLIIMEINDGLLEQIKLHLRVEGNEEDQLLIAYAQASADFVEKYCDGVLVESLTPPSPDEPPPREIVFTKGIWAAMLLLIGHWYNNREASGQNLSEIPLGVDDILFLNRRWN